LSRLQVARRIRCGVYAARQVHYCCRPSALPCPLVPLRPSLSLHSAIVSRFEVKIQYCRNRNDSQCKIPKPTSSGRLRRAVNVRHNDP
jgi:hypothetical protein